MSWILTSNVFLCVGFLFLTKNNGPFFTIKTWRQHNDGNTQLTIFKLIFSEKYELLEQKKIIEKPRKDLQMWYLLKLGVWATYFTMNSYLEKRGVKRVSFLWRPTWVTKNPFPLKLLVISTSALEYSSITWLCSSYRDDGHLLIFWFLQSNLKYLEFSEETKKFTVYRKDLYLEEGCDHFNPGITVCLQWSI